VSALNFHHLRYFYEVARVGSLTRAAAALRVSPSALSVQIQQIEAQLGLALFDRRNRRLQLTEAGRIALDHAETIFATGDELVETLKSGSAIRPASLRVGALATLSRNFQVAFLAPLRANAALRLQLRSGTLRELLTALAGHQLDVLLTNTLPGRDSDAAWTAHKLAEQPISVIGPRLTNRRKPRIGAILAREALIAPTPENHIRGDLDAYLQQAGITPRIVAEVDDMAMIRVLARAGLGYAVAPPIVVRDELRAGELSEYGQLGDLKETFYALVPKRRFPNRMVAQLLEAQRPGGRQRTD
jgi:LysR family transcriptional activator of nhaA